MKSSSTCLPEVNIEATDLSVTYRLKCRHLKRGSIRVVLVVSIGLVVACANQPRAYRVSRNGSQPVWLWV